MVKATPASHVQLTVRLLKLDCLSVHVSCTTTELLVKGLMWPALVSSSSSDVADSCMLELYHRVGRLCICRDGADTSISRSNSLVVQNAFFVASLDKLHPLQVLLCTIMLSKHENI